VFEKPEFAQWANENVVFLVGYKGKNHKVSPAKEDAEAPDGKAESDEKAEAKTKAPPKHKEGECLLYAGITCDEHEKILEDATEGKGGPKLEVNGYPTSYVITPDGKTFEKHKADREVKSLEDGVADFAKEHKVKPSKKYEGHLKALETGDKAAEDGRWKAALAAYLTVDAVAKKMPSLAARLPARFEALNDRVADAFGKTKDDAALDPVAKVKAVKALRSEVGAKPSSGPLPVVAEIDAWIKANPPPPPPKAK
jgi:hypothetical protein